MVRARADSRSEATDGHLSARTRGEEWRPACNLRPVDTDKRGAEHRGRESGGHLNESIRSRQQIADLIGGRTRTRTWDPLIKSQLLYQLSYAPGISPPPAVRAGSCSKAGSHCPAKVRSPQRSGPRSLALFTVRVRGGPGPAAPYR